MTMRRFLVTTLLTVAAPVMTSEAIPHRITNGLVGEWKEAVATPSGEQVPDSSLMVYSTGYDQTGYVMGGGSALADGWMGPGMDLSSLGTGRYIQVPNSPSLSFGTGDFTLNAWVRMKSINQPVKSIIDNRGSDGRGYTFSILNGNILDLYLGDSAGSSHYQSNPALAPQLNQNRWHHVAVSVRRTTWPMSVTFYVDGYPVGSGTPRTGAIVNTDQPFFIGGHKDNASYRFNDRIDEVIVFNFGVTDNDLTYVVKPGKSVFWPGFWNDPSRQYANNCYSYAANRENMNPNGVFAQPGRHSGVQAQSWDCHIVTQAAINDGFELVQGITQPAPSTDGFRSTVALVVAPGYDYHWYRRDGNNMWSHKPGMSASTTLDNSGQPISDPQYANRGIYTDFCGYFRVWSDSMAGVGHENIR
jgi:hypothetical protein